MAGYGYQQKKDASIRIQRTASAASSVQPKTARARVTGANASYKDLAEVCRSVRRKATDDAIEFLQLAAEKKKAIRFARHHSGKGHRRELGGKAGGWPIKSAKIVLGVLQNALANANRLGLGSTRVAHILANKQHTYPRMSPKGRRVRHDYETALVEVVLEEIQEKQDAGKKEEATKKVEAPKTPAPPKTTDVPKAAAPRQLLPKNSDFHG